ncbi:hypothetical protein [Actinacidiphila oryziradicis]|uniref:effector-associated constant component EACC1 n=1 Tax=Actinacidiphila oryziradicis TaxID=2571141 RepID=UPI0023F0759A|nr:hypothetical protein [Actinacidiphila oryziradicis]MCW2871606.1 hypothetical protein [Actinacidiphila oryziradicis]
MNATAFEFDGPAGEADELARSLAKWLNDDEDLSGSARLRMVPPAPGEQGGLADAAEVLSAAGPLADALVGGLFVWLVERVRSRRVSFKVTRPDGACVELSAGSVEEAAVVQQQLRQFLDPGPGLRPGPGPGAPS